jgi:hypothetical protein
MNNIPKLNILMEKLALKSYERQRTLQNSLRVDVTPAIDPPVLTQRHSTAPAGENEYVKKFVLQWQHA